LDTGVKTLLLLRFCGLDAGFVRHVFTLSNTAWIPIGVLTWVGCLVLEDLDEAVEDHGDQRAEEGANPVDPMVAVEGAEDRVGAE
jgi:hypothetical protein